MAARTLNGRTVVFAGGCRTPFLRAGTAFTDVMAYELGAMALRGLLDRTGLDPGAVDRVVMGTVLADPRTTNLARESALAAGLPASCPAFTVTAACASSNVAISGAVEAIASGAADVVVAGGAETLSDAPIRFGREVRKRLIRSQRAKGVLDWVKLLQGLSLKDLAPDTPAIAEFSTGQTMGQSAERLAKGLGLTREAQDRWALRSHRKAAAATRAGRYREQIVPARVPPSFTRIETDDGIRGDTTLAKLAALSPAFDRDFGTVTAGSSSFLTDGGAACLLTSAEAAERLGLAPRARVVATALVAMEPLEELLLGPVAAVAKALDAAGVSAGEVGVWEVHEAFAAPVLAFLKLLADRTYCRERLGRKEAVGRIDPKTVNAWGGSLALGHPFGATGARLMTTCVERMEREGAELGVVTTCAAGALGHAMVLAR
ncbi:MAG: acetyl-CoA C-acyltransferase [Thermoanaerobaculia bacterium]